MAEVLLICGGNGGGLVAKSCLVLATPWTITSRAPLSTGNYIKRKWLKLNYIKCKRKH